MTDSLFEDSPPEDPALDDADLDEAFTSDKTWTLTRQALREPVVIRAIAIAVVALVTLLSPGRSDRVLATLAGAALLVTASTSVWSAFRARPRAWTRLGVALVAFAIGAFLVVSADQSRTSIARMIGATLVVVAGRDLWFDLRKARRGGQAEGTVAEAVRNERLWPAMRTLSILALAGLLFAFPSEVLSATATVLAIGALVFSALILVASFDPSRQDALKLEDAVPLIGWWLLERPKSVDDREALYGKILFDGRPSQHRIVRFFALMSFASIIASMGVVTDSTAVVIGAMLIAPLMTPLMGMALSLVMGWPRRLVRSTSIAVGGIAVAIGVGLLIGVIVPALIDTSTNTQILGRASPTTLDLIIALAAGAAGAYGLSRPDVSDSLPGVAIAISLVPPLTVVGIAWSQGDWAAGNGALLLFSTNMLAILAMGGVTFILTGIAPIQRVAANQHRIRTSIASLAAAGGLVVGLLLVNGTQIATELFNQATVDGAIDDWIDPYPDHGVARVDVDDDIVSVTIVGPAEDAPPAAELAALLGERLDRTTTADVRLIVEEREVATSGE